MHCEKVALLPFSTLILLLLVTIVSSANAEPQRLKHEAQGNYLIIEILDEDLIHLEYGRGSGPGVDAPLATTDMICSQEDGLPDTVCTTGFSGSESFSDNGTGVHETRDLRLSVDPTTLAISVFDKTKGNVFLTTLRPENLDRDGKT